MPMLRSTYDGRLIYRTSYEGSKAILKYDLRLFDRVRKIAYDIPKINFCTFSVTIISRSYDKTYDNLTINRKIFCKSGP